MNSFDHLLKRLCPQTAVYWGAPEPNGFGGYTYADPVEIKCRWKEAERIVGNDNEHGITTVSRAEVTVLQDLEEEGCLYLGTLGSLAEYLESSAGTYIDPKDVNAERTVVYRIRRFAKIPRLGSTTDFVRVAYLSDVLY